jgi:hypothetical protein
MEKIYDLPFVIEASYISVWTLQKVKHSDLGIPFPSFDTYSKIKMSRLLEFTVKEF